MHDSWRRSREYLERSQKSLAGGVSSPFRRSSPIVLFFEDANGVTLQDVDGNRYIDYALAWGPLILGHKHPVLVEAVRLAAERPHNYGAQHQLEFEVAEQICRLVPCAERVAFTSSGSEAVQLAMRLARAFCGRNLVVKFEGHYHGWMDSALVSYHPRIEEMGPPEKPQAVLGSRGQMSGAAECVVVLPWNDVEAVARLFAERGSEIAAVITEPILCNSGCLMPADGFLAGLRRITSDYNALLIFDEIITGFRVAPGGGQALFGVTPDLTTLGKAVAGGLPLSVVAGRKAILDLIIDGEVVFGGTFNGNPLSLAGAKATLTEISRDDGRLLKDAAARGTELMNLIDTLGQSTGIAVRTTGHGAAFSAHFSGHSHLDNYRDFLGDDHNALQVWLRACLEEGIYLLPDGRFYLSVVHTESDIARTSEAFKKILERGMISTSLGRRATHRC
jgi:glutamate-1-semialdehyde 2,1-aminomutase